MRLNKDKHIGRVLFIVEGSRTEFSILRQIFCNLLGYSYVEKRRNRPTYFESSNDRFSKVGVINTQESNIRDISENEAYLDEVFDTLRDQCSSQSISRQYTICLTVIPNPILIPH